MGRIDDWFAEPKPPAETKHDKYTRRLVAWGWLRRVGANHVDLGWEPQSFYSLLSSEYVALTKEMLNEPLMVLGRYGGFDWTDNPEGPA